MEAKDVIDPDEFARMFEFEPNRRGAARVPALFSPHGHVLIAVARDRPASIPQIAELVDLSHAVVRQILADLIDAEMVAEVRIGRQARYVVIARDGTLDSTRHSEVAAQSRTAVERLYGLSRG